MEHENGAGAIGNQLERLFSRAVMIPVNHIMHGDMAGQKLPSLMIGLTLTMLFVSACGRGIRHLPVLPTPTPLQVTTIPDSELSLGQVWLESGGTPPSQRGNCRCEQAQKETKHNTAIDCTVEPIPECSVKSIEVLGDGVFPKWSAAKDLIAFNKVVDGNYEIHTMEPDGSNITCLTCNRATLPRGHKGQPYWHSSGKHLVFTVENTRFERIGRGLTAVPGIGRNHNVWIMTSNGTRFWQITDYPENWGVIRPSFSHDGKTLYWNEEYSMEAYPGTGSPWDLNKNPRGQEWGLWRIKLADVYLGSEGPEVSNIRNVLYPGLTLLEGFGFSPDDQRLLLDAANPSETAGTSYWGGDIYTSSLEGESLVRLSNTPYYNDENAEYSPDSKRIVWSHACGGAPAKEVDLFLMEADGGNKTRLTHFNDPGYAEYLSKTYGSGEIDWSPDGTRIVFSYGYRWQFKYPFIKYHLYMLTFEGACGNLR